MGPGCCLKLLNWGLLNFSFFELSLRLAKILTEHIETKNSLDSELQDDSIRSIRIRSRNRDIVEKRY